MIGTIKGGIGDNNAIGTTWEAWTMIRNDRRLWGLMTTTRDNVVNKKLNGDLE
jgi:hypothetical protein